MVDTKQKLKDYILRQLGAPYLEVEVTTDMMDDIIDETISEFSSFAYDGRLLEYLTFDINGKGEYNVNKSVESVLKLSKGGGLAASGSVKDGYVSGVYTDMITNTSGDAIANLIQISATSSLLDHFFGDEINYSYNSNKRKLYIYENYIGPLVMEAALNYIPNDTDEIYNHNWVKRMSVAQTRLLQSTVTGKLDTSLVGGARINYADMRTQANDEIQNLKEELFSKYGGPAPIFIG
jgi:hypothetical protein